MKHKQQGFTLIELVVVIVILGILAAVATPKFVDLTSKAETASGKGIVAAYQSAAVLQFANNNGSAVPWSSITAGVEVDPGDLSVDTSTSCTVDVKSGGSTVASAAISATFCS